MRHTRLKVILQDFRKFLVIFGVVAGIVCTAQAARADVVLPKKGMQFLTAGLSLNPGFLYDESASDSDGLATTAVTTSGMARLGLHQIITRQFFMSAEGEVGVQWLNEHTADSDGIAPASSNIAWQLGLYAHWLPFGERSGWSGSFGLHLFQAHLDEAPLQVLGGELRLGKYLWSDDEQFVLVQLGYSAPIIQGLSRPTDFTGEEEQV